MGSLPKAELKFLAPVPDRGVPTGAIALLGVLLVLVGYGLWYLHTEKERRLAAAIPSVPVELAPLAVPPKPPTPPPVPVQAAAQKPAPAPVAANAAAPALSAATLGTSSAPQPAAAPVATGDTGQMIVATGDSWVEVNDATGNILFSKVLHAGDSWPVPDEAGLTMTAGNAGGTEIAINGKAGAPLGAMGAVLHNYALTPPAAKPATPPAAN
jgi:cytoskeleton protein RodZ